MELRDRMKLSPRIGILRTARLPAQLRCVLLWLIVGAALEVLGRTLRSELIDAAALFCPGDHGRHHFVVTPSNTAD